MIFISVEIQNFLRIKESVGIELADQGLVLITGENGAGKSTIFEAIVWCLWGKTVRGYKHDKVINRTVGKDCWVRLKIEHEGNTYSVERYRKHHQHKNDVYFTRYTPQGPADMTDGTPTMTQAKINEWLGVDFDTYTRGPMVGQGNFKRFSQMTDAEQKAILETACQIDVLALGKKKAKEKASAIDLELSQAVREHTAAVQRVENAKDRIEDCEGLAATALMDWRHTMAQLYRPIAEHGMLIEGACQYRDFLEPPDLEGLVAARDRILQLHTKLIDKLQVENDSVREARAEAIGKHTELEQAVKRAEGQLSALVARQAGQCPTCLQDVSEEHLDGCREELGSKLLLLRGETQEAYGALQEHAKTLREVVDRQKDQRARANELKTQAEDRVTRAEGVLEEIEHWERELAEHTQERERALKSFLSWKKRPVPMGFDLDELLQELEEAKQERDATAQKVERLSDDLKYAQFWIQGFSNSGLKSLILDSIVPFLNDRAKVYAHNLTDGNVRVEFSTKTKLKSGEEREQFKVLVENVEGAEDYEGNSGGERARIDLAINFSLSDLMATRAKKAFPQRFFDEPFEGMDESGLEASMDLLANMIKECGTIFVVTHTPVMAALFNKVIKVAKRNGETTIQAA